ncbi:MAG: YbaK/EbsC family protein [Actinomycetota bacterium]
MSPEPQTDDLHPSAARVAEWAQARGLELQIHEYPEDGARTAQDAANAVGATVDQIVKSMIFAIPPAENEPEEDRPELVLALTAGSHRVDPDRLAAIAEAERCGRADPRDVRDATGYAIGGVPPFGHRRELRTWIDPHLLTLDELWAAAGTPRHVFPIDPERLVELTGATVADFTAEG